MVTKKNKHLEHYYKGKKFVPFYKDVLKSDAFRELSCKSRSLLFDLQDIEFPNRNGHVGLSEKAAAELLGCSENTASKAFEELQEQGFLERSFEGDYTQGKASEWRITYIMCKGREATNEWKETDPKKRDLRIKK